MKRRQLFLTMLLTAVVPQLSRADGGSGLTVYGLTVCADGSTIIVTDNNRADVLNDGGSVQFDGHSRLVLNGARLSYVESTLADGLEVYLAGASTIQSTYYAVKNNSGSAAPLTFTTDDSAPGSLTFADNTRSLTAPRDIFPGFSAPVYQGLLAGVLTKGETQDLVEVRVPLAPVVTDTERPLTVDYGPSSGMDNNTLLANETLDGILYTLSDDGTAASDGYDDANRRVVLYTTRSDGEVGTVFDAVSSGTLVPGTPEYAAAFTGLTFVVPAGTGTISLNTQTAAGYEFHLKIGSQDAVTVTDHDGGEYDDIPYGVSQASYCYLYLVGSGVPAPAWDLRRAGPKATISGGIGGLKVASREISTPPAATAEYRQLSSGDVQQSFDPGCRGLTVSASAAAGFTDLSADAFSGYASRDLSYIDLTGTSVTGKRFSRTSGAFAGIPEETLVYLPAGNSADGANFVIGGVCERAVLSGDSDGSFASPRAFTASKATFQRLFPAGEGQCYTVFLPYALKTSGISGDFFEYAGFDAATRTARLRQLTDAVLPANTPYVFRPSSGGALPAMSGVRVESTAAAASSPDGAEGDGLHGVYAYHEWTSAPSDIYCYSASDKDGIRSGQFVKVGAGTCIRPFRAYLRISSASSPAYVSIEWSSGATSIVNIEHGTWDIVHSADGWYTLDGRRLSAAPAQKGVYINNGRKVIR